VKRLGLLLTACCLAWGCSESTTRESAPVPASGRLHVQDVLGNDSAARFARAERPREFEFPADHGAHPDFRSEWWYVTVTLADEAGARFGLQFTVFRQALEGPGEISHEESPWRSRQLYMAHAALTDVARREHTSWQRFARGRPELAGATAQPFAVWIEDWRLASTENAFLPLEVSFHADDVQATLALAADKPLVLQGDRGLSRKGDRDASYYYSFPRLVANGTLRRGERVTRVHGIAWLDREWSTSVLAPGVEGWDWFALHLGDRTDVMAFQLRHTDGTRDHYDAATWIGPNGNTEALRPSDFALTPTRWWRDAQGTRWPIRWRLEGARWTRPWTIEAVLDDQRMDTAVQYWEGLVDVKDPKGHAIGEGYMELTGYGK
jgi:predicted secreted hydrolase